MAKNEKTVTLPVLPEGRVYISIARDLAVVLGCSAGARTVHPADHTDSIRDGTYAYGFRQCAGDGGALGKAASDADKKAGVLARADSIDNGTHVYGAGGGGARLSTYIVVLRENVLTALVGIGRKKGDVTKAVTTDPESAYMVVSMAMAKEIDGAEGQAVHAIMWPKVEAEAKVEAARRDKATGQFTMDDATREAILAAATAPKAEGDSDKIAA